MRKHLQAICVAALAAASAQAADYKPLLEEGKSWIMAYMHTAGVSQDVPGMVEYYQLREYTVDGVKVIDDVEYKCLTVKNLTSGSRVPLTYYLREENGVVSVRNHDANGYSDIPVLQFDVALGDSIFKDKSVEVVNNEYIEKNVYYYPSAINSVKGVDGEERSEIVFNDFSWVEGIGASHCKSWLCPIIASASSGGYRFVECRKDGKTIFTNKDFTYSDLFGLQTARTITPGKSWTMARGNEVFTVAVDRDTMIQEMPFVVLKSSEDKEYIVAEENGRVYAFLDKSGNVIPCENAMLISNTNNVYFTRQDAATETVLKNERWKQVGTNELTVGGRAFSEYLYEDNSEEVVASWVDGVGAPDSKSWAVVMPEDFQTLRMIDCRQDGEVIFTAKDFTYQSSISEVTASEAARSGIYDLQGRRIATPTRGLYIVDGQKRLLK